MVRLQTVYRPRTQHDNIVTHVQPNPYPGPGVVRIKREPGQSHFHTTVHGAKEMQKFTTVRGEAKNVNILQTRSEMLSR